MWVYISRQRKNILKLGSGSIKPARNTAAAMTRREALRRAAWILAAAGLPLGTSLHAEDVSPLMAALSKYMSEARDRALPDAIIEEAKHHILDTFAAMVSGSELPPGRQALKFAQAFSAEKGTTIVASQLLCGPIEAAIVNGELAHSDGELVEIKKMQPDVREMESLEWSQPGLELAAEAEEGDKAQSGGQ